jgi:hypothetical protein
VGGAQNHGGAGRVGAKALDRADDVAALAEGPDDPPATCVVPSPFANPAAITTQDGGAEPAGNMPAVLRVNVIAPIVFCAPLVPWASATIDNTVWESLNPG